MSSSEDPAQPQLTNKSFLKERKKETNFYVRQAHCNPRGRAGELEQALQERCSGAGLGQDDREGQLLMAAPTPQRCQSYRQAARLRVKAVCFLHFPRDLGWELNEPHTGRNWAERGSGGERTRSEVSVRAPVQRSLPQRCCPLTPCHSECWLCTRAYRALTWEAR